MVKRSGAAADGLCFCHGLLDVLNGFFYCPMSCPLFPEASA